MSFDLAATIPVTALLLITWIHFIGDFVMQSDAMAKSKSKDFGTLLLHVGTYTLMIFPACLFIPSLKSGLLWVGVNAILHLCVDFVTSRVSSRYFARGDVHNGFVTIGFDQMLHLACLTLTWAML